MVACCVRHACYALDQTPALHPALRRHAQPLATTHAQPGSCSQRAACCTATTTTPRRSRDNIRTVLQGVYMNQGAVDDELVDIIYGPSEDQGALDVFVSVISGGRRTYSRVATA